MLSVIPHYVGFFADGMQQCNLKYFQFSTHTRSVYANGGQVERGPRKDRFSLRSCEVPSTIRWTPIRGASRGPLGPMLCTDSFARSSLGRVN